MESKVIENQTLRGGKLVLTKDLHWYLGPGLVLEDCEIDIRQTARWIHLRGGALKNCKIHANTRLVNFQDWSQVTIEGCSFTGQYRGNDFGDQEGNGHILADCVFTGAELEACRFYGDGTKSLTFPSFPHVVIWNPATVRLPGSATDVRPEFHEFIEFNNEEEPAVRAAVEFIPSLAKQMKVDEAELRDFLESLVQDA